jgi:mRNA-degrading endonuclease YafQ of YafQ-DinJ toxin-antitoxin module
MHTKINTHQIDPNFLTHELGSKTRLGMQHVHLELLWILIYAITKRNKHISRINISDNYKIVINSPEVHFGIKR